MMKTIKTRTSKRGTYTYAFDDGKKVLLFGDFSYYWVADRTNRTMRRLNELYAMIVTAQQRRALRSGGRA